MVTTWVLLAGLPATGKSTLARTLAARLGGIVLDKDRVRDALLGAAVDYSPEQNELCMQAILHAAAYLTGRRLEPFLFFDGRTFSRQSHIQPVIQAADSAGAHWRILHLTCSDEAAEARLSTQPQNHPAHDRNLALYKRIQASFEPIAWPHLDIDTSAGIEWMLEDILTYLKG